MESNHYSFLIGGIVLFCSISLLFDGSGITGAAVYDSGNPDIISPLWIFAIFFLLLSVILAGLYLKKNGWNGFFEKHFWKKRGLEIRDDVELRLEMEKKQAMENEKKIVEQRNNGQRKNEQKAISRTSGEIRKFFEDTAKKGYTEEQIVKMLVSRGWRKEAAENYCRYYLNKMQEKGRYSTVHPVSLDFDKEISSSVMFLKNAEKKKDKKAEKDRAREELLEKELENINDKLENAGEEIKKKAEKRYTSKPGKLHEWVRKKKKKQSKAAEKEVQILERYSRKLNEFSDDDWEDNR